MTILMLIFTFAAFSLSFNFFSPESLVTTLVGGIAAFGLTRWFKKQTGAMGIGAMILAIFVSVLVAVVAVMISTLLSGNGFSADKVAASATQVFAAATIAYKTLMADSGAAQ